jgi:hypothetical protein
MAFGYFKHSTKLSLECYHSKNAYGFKCLEAKENEL